MVLLLLRLSLSTWKRHPGEASEGALAAFALSAFLHKCSIRTLPTSALPSLGCALVTSGSQYSITVHALPDAHLDFGQRCEGTGSPVDRCHHSGLGDLLLSSCPSVSLERSGGTRARLPDPSHSYYLPSSSTGLGERGGGCRNRAALFAGPKTLHDRGGRRKRESNAPRCVARFGGEMWDKMEQLLYSSSSGCSAV